MDITFEIKGHAHPYTIPSTAYYNDDRIVQLPNGDLYEIGGWLESMPPQPQLRPFTKTVNPLNPVKAKRKTT